MHGETEAKEGLRARLREERGIDALVPAPGDVLDLDSLRLSDMDRADGGASC